MWMNVDDRAKNHEFMWMKIHIQPPSSTFVQINPHKKNSGDTKCRQDAGAPRLSLDASV
jgi:hypothetical protein